MIKPIALANTFAILDVIGHTLIHLWTAVNPSSYEYIMQLFVAGLRLNVDPALELLPTSLLLSTTLEAGIFWAVGFIGGSLYNKLAR